MCKVIIAGGGIAGLVTGLSLARTGFEVEIYEATDQLGGKAGANPNPNDLGGFPFPIEHGYHIFPGWYKNVRSILKIIGSLENLVDLRNIYYIRPPFLFGIGLEYQRDLEVGELSKPFRQQLESQGITLSRDLTIEAPVKGSRWRIRQNDTGPTYVLNRGQEALNIYRATAGEEDIPTIIEVRQGYKTARELFSNMKHNISNGPVPWYNVFQGYYAILDLLMYSYRRRCALDRVSLNGFFRSKWYATSVLADFGQESVLQASAIPAYEVSAMTMQKLARLWLNHPHPWLSVLNTDLQSGFIDPLANQARADGCAIFLNRQVDGLLIENGEVSGLRVCNQGKLQELRADYTVIATPPEVARSWTTGINQSVDEKLTSLGRLESRPMASLHIAFNTRIPNLPKGHVLLSQSRYALSFIDISQIWQHFQNPRNEPNTVLSVISSNFLELENLPEWLQISKLLNELVTYVPSINYDNIIGAVIRPNTQSPLYINTVGNWKYRPSSAIEHAENGDIRIRKSLTERLYFTGDYVQNDADLTCMEGAVQSALSTAYAIAKAEGREVGIKPIPLTPYSTRLFWLWFFARLVCFPGTLIAKLMARFAEGQVCVD